jgi:hypothetical protein
MDLSKEVWPSRWSFATARHGALMAACIVAISLGAGGMSPVESQTGALLIGRVTEVGANVPIEAATVELAELGSTLTTPTGAYHFDALEAGAYVVRVTAFGYASETRRIFVDGLTVADFELRIAPLTIDSLSVDLRVVEIEGRVLDATGEFPIVDAVIFTSWGMIEADSHGRFRLESIPAGEPLPLRLQAFGYHAVDTVIVPDQEDGYHFELVEDPGVRALIDAQVARMTERIGFRWSVMLRPLNREDLVKHAGSATMWDVLLTRYERWLDRVTCVLLDEVVIGLQRGPIHNTLYAAQGIMQTLVPEEVERVEFFAYGGRLQGMMMRVYTRNFMSDLLTGSAELVDNPHGHDINCV